MKDTTDVKHTLRIAFDEMISRLQAARDAIDTPDLYPAPPDERNLAEGYRYLMGFLLGSIERALHDPLHPRFMRAIQPMNPSTVPGRSRRVSAARFCILPIAFCSAMSRTLQVFNRITSASVWLPSSK